MIVVSPRYGAVLAEAPTQYSMGVAHIEGDHGAARAAAPMANAGPGMAPALKTKKGCSQGAAAATLSNLLCTSTLN